MVDFFAETSQQVSHALLQAELSCFLLKFDASSHSRTHLIHKHINSCQLNDQWHSIIYSQNSSTLSPPSSAIDGN